MIKKSYDLWLLRAPTCSMVILASSQVRSMGDSIAAAEPEAQFRRTFRTPYFGEEAEQRTATDEELRDR